MAGTASLAMLVPYLLKRAIDAIQQGQPPSQVAIFAAAIVGVAVVQGVVRTFSRFIIFNAGRDVEFDLRSDLFAHLLKLPPGWYLHQRTGDLMSRLVNDVTAVRMLLGPGLLSVAQSPILFVGAFIAMSTLSLPRKEHGRFRVTWTPSASSACTRIPRNVMHRRQSSVTIYDVSCPISRWLHVRRHRWNAGGAQRAGHPL